MKKRKKLSIRELLYQTDPYIKFICKSPIFIILFLVLTAVLYFLRKSIGCPELLMYLIALYFPPILVWIIKALTNSGNAWNGGMVSGHSAFLISIYILNIKLPIENPLFLLLPILPIAFILKSRCAKTSSNLAIKGLILGISFQVGNIILLLYHQKNWLLILANIAVLLLVIESYLITNVHQKKEVFYGMILGMLSTLFFTRIFLA